MAVSQKHIRAITRRRLWWYSCAFVIAGLVIGQGVIARAQGRRPTEQRSVRGVGKIDASLADARNEFVLHAPANRVAAIAARRGLTVIRRLDPNRDIFLVSGPSRFGSRFDRIRDDDSRDFKRLLDDVQDDADVSQFEVNSLVVTPEVASGINLTGSTAAILAALADRSLVDFFGGPVWNGYAQSASDGSDSPAGMPCRRATGAGIVAIIDTGVDPNHPLLAGSLVPGYDFLLDTEGGRSDGRSRWIAGCDPRWIARCDPRSGVGRPAERIDGGDPEPGRGGPADPTLVPPAFGHGTMVAGLVHLVAPTAKIMPLKAFNANGTSTCRYRSRDLLRGGPWRAGHQHELQRDGRVARDRACDQHGDQPGRHLRRVCRQPAARKILVYPGALRNVLGVGSTTQPVRQPGAHSATTETRSSAWAPRAKGSSPRIREAAMRACGAHPSAPRWSLARRL